MANFICITCGTQYEESPTPPEACPICLDERQYVNPVGQQWTTLDALQKDHANDLRTHEPNLTGIGTTPKFAIGERALLVQSPHGNVLWDCMTFIDQPTVDAVNALGGLKAIAISHPHFYSTMIEWSRGFGGVPIYLHASNRPYVSRSGPEIVFWDGETHDLGDGMTLIRCGGHFEGSTVMHWQAGADGRGALFTGDTITVVADHRYVTFMYSYPNMIPLPAAAVERIVASIEPFAFDRLYGGWWDSIVPTDAKVGVEFSAQRYVEKISGGAGARQST